VSDPIPQLDGADLDALVTILREQRLDPAKVDRTATLSAIREYFRMVRYHLDPKLGPLRSVWGKLAQGEPLPPTPRLTVGPSRPNRRTRRHRN